MTHRAVAYLGTHKPGWLWMAGARPRLYVSHVTLAPYKTLHRATGPWGLDSGGFSELAAADQPRGAARWRTSPEEYVQAVARYAEEIGHLEWAAPQDWMCEPAMIHGGQVGMVEVAGTGLSVAEHQARTVANFLELRELWPGATATCRARSGRCSRAGPMATTGAVPSCTTRPGWTC